MSLRRGDELEELAQIHVIVFTVLQNSINEWLDLCEHIFIWNVVELSSWPILAWLLLVDVLVGIEEGLKISQRVIHLELSYIGLHSALAPSHIAAGVEQQRSRLVLAALINAKVLPYIKIKFSS